MSWRRQAVLLAQSWPASVEVSSAFLCSRLCVGINYCVSDAVNATEKDVPLRICVLLHFGVYTGAECVQLEQQAFNGNLLCVSGFTLSVILRYRGRLSNS